jgi:hypothetical protein
MKQRGDGRWWGHRDITYAAVARLYQVLSCPDDTIHGVPQKVYSDALDLAQAYQDRPIGAGLIENHAGTGESYPYVGPGPTTHSAYRNPNVQREHFMADPYRKGPDNLRTNSGYILEQLAAAHRSASAEDEITYLGAAAHALQDSYSGAHAWREESVYEGEVTAPVQSLHVFTPGHAVGIDDGKNTHADEFDRPPTESGSARAAVEATYLMLRCYELNRDNPPEEAAHARRAVMEPMLRPSAQGVTVSLHPDREWAAERDRRLALEQASARRPSQDELTRLTRVLAPDTAHNGLRRAVPPQSRSVSRGITGEGLGRGG